ncbi:aminoglycoside phosphotransferase family protein [Nocardioides sp.]|uniref:aminoglycoside phosphotransferase family protein n=1 Tax=Nocardioides sp. TaxID=35761 RepID=UPI002BC0F31E|nr:aminoglycoside phosphotransferase family protein [Nocardioides sp.]HXH79490.1 aminoglycoside phosphotransferase family protein [Nocardioides sp.]
MISEDSEALAGGNMGEVSRRGDTVVRPAGAWTPAVHRLLRELVAAGVRGVPQPVTIGEDHEVLGFIIGTVPNDPTPEWVWAEAALLSSARLLRRAHDVTSGLDTQGPWRSPVREPAEVICHNDFAPYNLVFDKGVVVGAIDWDYASPGPRLWDLAYLAYRIVPLSCGDRRDGFTDEERAQRLRRLLAAYGCDAEPRHVNDVLRDRLLALATFSDDMAQRLGKPELSEHAALYRSDAAGLTTTEPPAT